MISREKNNLHFTPAFLKRYPAPEIGTIPIFLIQTRKNKSSCSFEEHLQSVKPWDALHPGIPGKYSDFFLLALKKRIYCYTIYSAVLGNLRAV